MTSPTMDPEVQKIKDDARAHGIRMKHVLAESDPPQSEVTWWRWTKQGAEPKAKNVRAVRAALDAAIAKKNAEIPA